MHGYATPFPFLSSTPGIIPHLTSGSRTNDISAIAPRFLPPPFLLRPGADSSSSSCYISSRVTSVGRMHAVNQGSAHASQEAVRIAVVISRLGRCEDIIPKALLWFLLPLPSSSNSPFFLISSDCNGAAICHLGMKKIWRRERERKSTKGGRIFWRVPRDVRSRKFRTIERGKLYGMDLEVK